MADFTPPPKNGASPFADMRGHHVAVRTPSLAEAKEFYVGKLDFRVIAEWDYADEKPCLTITSVSTSRAWTRQSRSSAHAASRSSPSPSSSPPSVAGSPSSATPSAT